MPRSRRPRRRSTRSRGVEVQTEVRLRPLDRRIRRGARTAPAVAPAHPWRFGRGRSGRRGQRQLICDGTLSADHDPLSTVAYARTVTLSAARRKRIDRIVAAALAVAVIAVGVVVYLTSDARATISVTGPSAATPNAADTVPKSLREAWSLPTNGRDRRGRLAVRGGRHR